MLFLFCLTVSAVNSVTEQTAPFALFLISGKSIQSFTTERGVSCGVFKYALY